MRRQLFLLVSAATLVSCKRTTVSDPDPVMDESTLNCYFPQYESPDEYLPSKIYKYNMLGDKWFQSNSKGPLATDLFQNIDEVPEKIVNARDRICKEFILKDLKKRKGLRDENATAGKMEGHRAPKKKKVCRMVCNEEPADSKSDIMAGKTAPPTPMPQPDLKSSTTPTTSLEQQPRTPQEVMKETNNTMRTTRETRDQPVADTHVGDAEAGGCTSCALKAKNDPLSSPLAKKITQDSRARNANTCRHMMMTRRGNIQDADITGNGPKGAGTTAKAIGSMHKTSPLDKVDSWPKSGGLTGSSEEQDEDEEDEEEEEDEGGDKDE